MQPLLAIRLAICVNDCPVGSRIERGEPLPSYKHTYDDSPSGREEAEKDLEKIAAYIERNKDQKGSKNEKRKWF